MDTAVPEPVIGGGDADTEWVAMSEAQVVALAAVTWVGAMLAVPVPLWPAVGGGLVSVALRRGWMLVACIALVASALGHRSEVAFQPVEASDLEGWVSLVSDPRPFGPGWRCVARLDDGRRVEITAYGAAGNELARHLAGDRLQVSGRLRPMQDQPWARARHLLGRLSLEEVTGTAGPGPARAVVEEVRAVVAAGADPLPEHLRPLYLGLVIGEDRFQPAAQRARFRAAGLTHLLAVSGQNVAFVLSVARPLTRLLGRRGRFVATGILLVVFAVATRLEPSVLRATVTAGLAAGASLSGHRQSGVRLLGLTVTALVLIDPFLVYSVGFQLSVAASAGILIVTPSILARLARLLVPSVVAEPLAVTLGAQVAVVPLLLGYFGPVSLSSVPANLLAGWAAGAVMTWGLTVGVVAGLAPDPVAGWLQLPAAALVTWLDGVAAWASRLPLPALTGPEVALAAFALTAAAWLVRTRSPTSSTRRRWLSRCVLAAVATVGVVIAVGTVPRPPGVPARLGGDGDGWWIPGSGGHPSVLVVEPGADYRLLDALTASRITSVDLVIARSGDRWSAELVSAAGEVSSFGVVLAPAQHRIVGARRVTTPLAIPTAAGTLLVMPSDGDDRLDVTLLPLPAGPAHRHPPTIRDAEPRRCRCVDSVRSSATP